MRFETNEDRDLFIRDQAQTIRDMQAMLEQVPLEAGTGGASAVELYKILDGQTLPPANIDGIIYSTTEVSLIIDDPETTGTRSDGLGRAENISTGAKIMVVHDSSAPYASGVANANTAYRETDYGVIVGSRSVTVGADTTVYYYIARF